MQCRELLIAGVLGGLEVLRDPPPDVALNVDCVARARDGLFLRSERLEGLVNLPKRVAKSLAALEDALTCLRDRRPVALRELHAPFRPLE